MGIRMESFFVLMSELTVLGEGQDRTKQTTMIFQSSGQMLLNAAAQVHTSRNTRYRVIVVEGSWKSFVEEAACEVGLKGMDGFSGRTLAPCFGFPNRP